MTMHHPVQRPPTPVLPGSRHPPPCQIWDLQRCAGGAGPSSLLLGGAGRASGRGPKLSAKAKASGEAPRVVVSPSCFHFRSATQ